MLYLRITLIWMIRNMADKNKYAKIEDAISAGLTVEDAPGVYALTDVPEGLRRELQLDGKLGYRAVKRAFDIVSSACGMVVLSPVILGTAIAVKVTSPGPVLFRQRRVGRGKKLFDIYKFRTMRTDTPNLPSHMINANDWFTPIGATLRKFSLDELPQLWNIFKGDMSVIGPRPALWSQFNLVAARDEVGANDVRPGLTGWAQINGRDEISIENKVALDGEYVRRRGIAFDIKCFLGTFSKLSGSEVVEAEVTEPDDTEGEVQA